MAGQDNLNRFGTGILRLVAGWLLLSAAPVACFSTSKAPPSERTCESNCDRQVKAGCSQTEADFAATCKQACLAYRLDYPDCVSEMDTLSGCVEDKVRFSCDPTGALSKDPVAICMDQAYACAGCTGDFSACSN
jgi:hypothetical protein